MRRMTIMMMMEGREAIGRMMMMMIGVVRGPQ
jgi:hypothetical protein